MTDAQRAGRHFPSPTIECRPIEEKGQRHDWEAACSGVHFTLDLLWAASFMWQRDQLVELMEQRLAIDADIAEMKAAQAPLKKKGARFKTATCGRRLCVASVPIRNRAQ